VSESYALPFLLIGVVVICNLMAHFSAINAPALFIKYSIVMN